MSDDDRSSPIADRPTSTDRTAAGDRGSTTGPRRDSATLRWPALLSPLVVPWAVVRTTETTLVFPWGTVWLEVGRVAWIHWYLAQPALPQYLQLWPIAVACYVAALAWAAGRRFGADQRVTAALFVLVAVSIAWFSAGMGVEPMRTSVPLGSIHAIALAVWVYVTDG